MTMALSRLPLALRMLHSSLLGDTVRTCRLPTGSLGDLKNLAVQITLLIIISSSHYKFAGPSFSWRRGHQSFAPIGCVQTVHSTHVLTLVYMVGTGY